jgi:hypothetical protein
MQPRANIFQEYFLGEKITTPTLHVIGSLDTIVPPPSSELFADKFDNPLILKHNGGHHLPKSSQNIDTLIQFIINQKEKKS